MTTYTIRGVTVPNNGAPRAVALDLVLPDKAASVTSRAADLSGLGSNDVSIPDNVIDVVMLTASGRDIDAYTIRLGGQVLPDLTTQFDPASGGAAYSALSSSSQAGDFVFFGGVGLNRSGDIGPISFFQITGRDLSIDTAAGRAQADGILGEANPITVAPVVALRDLPGVEITENDAVTGTRGRDRFATGQGDDTVDGAQGRDTLVGGKGRDELTGGNGADVLRGGGGRDDLDGGKSGDRLFGNGGKDMLDGGQGPDQLRGGGGGDTIEGGRGNDTLTGNGGNDVFVFEARTGTDTVTDFDPSVDEARILTLRQSDLSPQETVEAFGSIQGGDAVIAHPVGTLIFAGVTELDALASAMEIFPV